MKPIDPAEISALLDGELPPDRAEEVRRAIAADPALRRVHEQLAALDADLRAHAERMVFQPRVSLAGAAAGWGPRVWPAALGLLAVRLIVKVVPAGVGLAVEAVVLALVVGWLLRSLYASPQLSFRGYMESA